MTNLLTRIAELEALAEKAGQRHWQMVNIDYFYAMSRTAIPELCEVVRECLVALDSAVDMECECCDAHVCGKHVARALLTKLGVEVKP